MANATRAKAGGADILARRLCCTVKTLIRDMIARGIKPLIILTIGLRLIAAAPVLRVSIGWVIQRVLLKIATWTHQKLRVLLLNRLVESTISLT